MTEIADLIRTLPAAFLRWWLGELAGLLPSWLKTEANPARSTLILEVRGREAVLHAKRSRGGEVLGRADGDTGGDRPGAGLSALGERRYRRWPLIVRLAADLGLSKVIELPLAARDDLGNLLQFELDRLTPFRPDEVCLAWRVLETDRAQGRMKVAMEMAPRALVENALDMVSAQGRSFPLISADRVEIESRGAHAPLDLMANRAAPATGGWIRRALPLLVVALALVAAWLPLSRQQRLVERLEQEVLAHKADAEEVLQLREQLDAEASEAGFLTQARNDRASMTGVLAELTRLIPDHSHILQLDIEGGRIQLNGLADKASDLITNLDRSAMFTAPEFRAAVTRDPRNDKERFQIAVELTGRTP